MVIKVPEKISNTSIDVENARLDPLIKHFVL